MAHKIQDIVYLLDVNEDPIGPLDTMNLEVDLTHDDINSIEIDVDMNDNIIPEQQILFRGNRYVVTEVVNDRKSGLTSVTADALFVELNDNEVSHIEIDGMPLTSAIKKILNNSRWEVGTIEGDTDTKHYLDVEEVTRLYAIRRLADLAGLLLRFDTVNRRVHILESVDKEPMLFRYGKNISEISKTTQSPKATILRPVGKGGLTIQSVNDGKETLEDLSWYTGLGIDEKEARKRFSKEHTWEDERFIYAGNLMREGEKQLSKLAHPQITYEVKATHFDHDVELGDYAYIVDEDLGVKIKAQVKRILDHKDRSKNELEFDYINPGIHNTSEKDGEASSSGESKNDIVLEKSREEISIGNAYSAAIVISFSTFAPTNMQIGLAMTGEASVGATMEGYFSVSDTKVGVPIKQEIQQGFNTININAIATQVQEGSDVLQFFAKVSSGNFTISPGDMQFYIIADNLLGGQSSQLPKANVTEYVDIGDMPFILEKPQTSVIEPEVADVTDTVPMNTLDIGTSHTIDFTVFPDSIVPPMTSNKEPAPYVVSASGYVSGQDPYYAFDGGSSDYWEEEKGNKSGWLQIDMGEPTAVSGYTILQNREADRSPRIWDVKGSNDGNNWDVIESRNHDAWSVGSPERFDFNTEQQYRYYRLDIKDNNGNSNWLVVGQWKLF